MTYYKIRIVLSKQLVYVEWLDVIQASKRPKDEYKQFELYDAYTKWFDSLEKAERYIGRLGNAIKNHI